MDAQRISGWTLAGHRYQIVVRTQGGHRRLGRPRRLVAGLDQARDHGRGTVAAGQAGHCDRSLPPFQAGAKRLPSTTVAAKLPCNWVFADWGLGWSFAPDYCPSGETLFTSGSVANSNGYANPTNDALINQTLTTSTLRTGTS
jgi:hypothetical protein